MNDTDKKPVSDERRIALDFHSRAVAEIPRDQNLAYRLLGSAVDIDPSFASGWTAVGNANADLSLLPAAVACYRRALELDGLDDQTGGLDRETKLRTLVNVGHRLHALGRHEEAKRLTMAAIQLDPKNPYAWCNLSLIQSTCGDLPSAVKSARKGVSFATTDYNAEMALAFALLFSGEYAEGLKHFEARFPYKLQQYLDFPYPMWRGEEVERLYIAAEQGMGDTLSFIRFVPAVCAKVAQVFMMVQPELVRLFRLVLAAHDNLTITPLPGPLPAAEAWVSMTSIPVALGMTNDEIRDAPGLPIPPIYAPAPWKAPGRKCHIAVAYAGSPLNEIDKWRSIPVHQLLELYRVPGIQLYSLQVGERVQDLHSSGCAPLIKDLAPNIRDVCDAIAILHEMDLVVTVETALGHIAGAIGKECWTLYAYNGGDWRHGRARRHPIWYPTTTIFKQGADAQWQPVLSRVVGALHRRLQA